MSRFLERAIVAGLVIVAGVWIWRRSKQRDDEQNGAMDETFSDAGMQAAEHELYARRDASRPKRGLFTGDPPSTEPDPPTLADDLELMGWQFDRPSEQE
jgi:hypothetical protein